MHRKDFDNAGKVKDLIQTYEKEGTETIATGLICIQKDYDQAIKDLNVAYLVIICKSYETINEGLL
jgi:hypothetical protein